jgi:hypothetical protein
MPHSRNGFFVLERDASATTRVPACSFDKDGILISASAARR